MHKNNQMSLFVFLGRVVVISGPFAKKSRKIGNFKLKTETTHYTLIRGQNFGRRPPPHFLAKLAATLLVISIEFLKNVLHSLSVYLTGFM